MWISKQIIKEQKVPAVECGKVTMSSNGAVEATSTGVERNVNFYSPYGYNFCIPKGERLLLTQGGGEQVCIGVENDSSNVEYGEIKIMSLSGAYIHLKNDGSKQPLPSVLKRLKQYRLVLFYFPTLSLKQFSSQLHPITFLY